MRGQVSLLLILLMLPQAVSQEPASSDAAEVERWVQDAWRAGDIQRGAMVFADVKLACNSCHTIGDTGGTVGPDLSKLAKQRPEKHIVESVLWPNREVEPQFVSWKILTADGEVFTGFKVQATARAQSMAREHRGGAANHDRNWQKPDLYDV